MLNQNPPEKQICAGRGKAWFRSAAGVPGHKEFYVHPQATKILLALPKCDLDIYATNEAKYIARMVQATGPSRHVSMLKDQATKFRGVFSKYNGLLINGVLMQSKTEQEFYETLKLRYVPPEDRK